jgi:hypothetical protein
MEITKLDARTRILKALFQRQKVNYLSMVMDEGIHRNIARREMDKLEADGLIAKEGSGRGKRGKPLFYFLTEKGFDEYLHKAFESLDIALDDVAVITKGLLSDPEKLKAWANVEWERFFERTDAILDEAERCDTPLVDAIFGEIERRPMPLKEMNRQIEAERGEICRPLIESYLNMNRIVSQMLSPKYKIFVGITKEPEGVVMSVSDARLKKRLGLRAEEGADAQNSA